MNKWTGMKFIIYNISPTSVRMESYVNTDGKWVKAYSFDDTLKSDWSGKEVNNKCLDPETRKPRSINTTLYWSAPHVAFRGDNMIFAFKDLSVREICAHPYSCGSSSTRKGCFGYPFSC